MNKNVIIAVVVAMFVGAGVAIFIARQGAQEEGPSTAETTTRTEDTNQSTGDDEATNTIVAYTDDGFSPAEVTVQVGEAVTFRNDSTGDMWVASDPHPIHTDLPEFDSQGEIEPGGEYTVTLSEPGEWGYHDHLQSFQEGVVIVQ